MTEVRISNQAFCSIDTENIRNVRMYHANVQD